MASLSVAVTWWSTKPVRWKPALPVAAASAAAVVAATVVAAAAAAVAAATVVVVAAVTAVAAAVTDPSRSDTQTVESHSTTEKRGLLASFLLMYMHFLHQFTE